MLTIKMDKRPIEALENDLDKFHDRALPYAVRDTLNTLAYETSRIAKKNADRLMVMRNTYTSRSIQFERAQGLKVDQMKSAAGSLQEYMREQEEGFTRHRKGKHGVPVPTSFAAGQQGAVPRSKPIRRQLDESAQGGEGNSQKREVQDHKTNSAPPCSRGNCLWKPIYRPGSARKDCQTV